MKKFNLKKALIKDWGEKPKSFKSKKVFSKKERKHIKANLRLTIGDLLQ